MTPRPIKLAVLDETAQAELYRRVKQRQAEQDAAWKRAARRPRWLSLLGLGVGL